MNFWTLQQIFEFCNSLECLSEKLAEIDCKTYKIYTTVIAALQYVLLISFNYWLFKNCIWSSIDQHSPCHKSQQASNFQSILVSNKAKEW